MSSAVVLGLVFLWGLIAPRTQWYALVGWTRSNPRESEPGAVAYGAGRVVCFIGLIVLAVLGANYLAGTIRFQDEPLRRPPTVVEQVWGEPRSFVVDRVFTPLAAPPAGLVEQAVEGFQVVDAVDTSPQYLFEAGRIRSAGLATLPSFLGVEPIPGQVALDTADVVVHVRGDERCIPQAVAVIPVDGAVQVGVFFGRAQVPDAVEPVDPADCDPAPPAERTRGYLIPVDLQGALGDRVLQSLAGLPIDAVPLP